MRTERPHFDHPIRKNFVSISIWILKGQIRTHLPNLSRLFSMPLPDSEPLSSSHGNLTPPRISPSRITAISAIRKYHYHPDDHGSLGSWLPSGLDVLVLAIQLSKNKEKIFIPSQVRIMIFICHTSVIKPYKKRLAV